MSMYDGPKKVTFDERALDHLLNSPRGEVGRYMRKIGLRIQAGAKAIVPVRTGRLKASIKMKHSRTTRAQKVVVGSGLNYALVVHEGAKPHLLRPQGRVLRFNVQGRVVYAQHVNHPGFRGRKYLEIPMRAVVRGK